MLALRFSILYFRKSFAKAWPEFCGKMNGETPLISLRFLLRIKRCSEYEKGFEWGNCGSSFDIFFFFSFPSLPSALEAEENKKKRSWEFKLGDLAGKRCVFLLAGEAFLEVLMWIGSGLAQLWEMRLAQDLHGQVEFPVPLQPFCVTAGKCFTLQVPHLWQGQNCFPASGGWPEEKCNKGWEIMRPQNRWQRVWATWTKLPGSRVTTVLYGQLGWCLHYFKNLFAKVLVWYL